jgi:transposase
MSRKRSETAWTWVGADIGAYRHRVCIGLGAAAREFDIENTPAGARELVRALKGKRARVSLEATGIYYLDLALALAAADIEVMVVNPRMAHHFIKALGRRSKTDALDARALAEYAARMPWRAWQPPRKALLELRAIARQIEAITRARAGDKNRLHALGAQAGAPRVLVRDLQGAVRGADRRIAKLAGAARKLIEADSELEARYAALTSATGIGQTSALAILAELALLPRDMRSRECTSHAGLDVRLVESGSSVHKRPRLSKHGNRHLRAALYMPALVAVQHDPITRAYYEHLIAQGKTRMQALGAVMRKYLTACWAIVKDPKPFDTEQLFDITPSEAPLT